MIAYLINLLRGIAIPLPQGICLVELFGHVTIRGTVRWRGPFVEVHSHEPGDETTTLHAPAAFYSLRPLDAYGLRQLLRERQEHDEREKKKAEAERLIKDARAHPENYVHSWSYKDDGRTFCDRPGEGLRVTSHETDVTCPECQAEDIPF